MSSPDAFIDRILAELQRDPSFAGFAGPNAALLIWDGQGQGLLHASSAAGGLRAGEGGNFAPAAASRLRALAEGAAPASGLRLERLRLHPFLPPLVCACRRVALDGREVLVTAIVGPLPKPAARTAPPRAVDVPPPSAPEATRTSTPAPRPAPAGADPRGKGTVRFLWQADASARFTSVSPDLADTVGPMAGDIVGQTWDEVANSVVEDPTGEVAGLFARRLTWSGRALLWSVDNSAWQIPVDWAGMPVFGPGRTLIGFRGFGLLRTDAALERQDDEAPQAPIEREAENSNESGERRSMEPAAPPDRDPPGEGWFADIRERVAAQLGRRFAPPPERTAPVPEAPSEPARPLEAHSRLSTAERSAFREIARALGARSEPETDGVADDLRGEERPLAPAPPAERPEPDGMPEPPRPAPPFAGTGGVLERLPLGALVHREERVLFANRMLLDLAGYDSVEDLAAEGGLGRLIGGSLPLVPTGGLTPLTLAARQGSLPVEAQVAAIEWDGAPAGLVLVRQTPAADLAARLEAAEDALAARDARLRELEDEARGLREGASRLQELEAARASGEARMRDLEAAQSEQTARLRELEGILDTATDGVVVTDETGRILSLNRSAEALFGYEAAEVVGDAITVLLAPESHIVVLDYLERLRSSGMARALNDGREVAGRVRQGGSIPLFMAMGPVQDGPHPRVCAVLRDITAFKKAEAELTAAKRTAEAANAQKSDVLAKISHEIRTPLNAIIGFAEVMLEERFGPVGNDRYKEYLRDVHASGSHVISLVNDLLDLAKIEAGRMDLSFTGVGLNELVQASVSLLQPQAARERIVMRTSFAQKLPAVVADERSLRQIALNLVSNAIKFTDAGGQVIVSTAFTDRGEVAFRVRDTGLGMSEAEIAAALEPFRQLNTTRKRGGSGLGLPLTKALVEANSGAMHITSHPGEGTLVEVLFPPSRVMAD